jgi:hypothetical protein
VNNTHTTFEKVSYHIYELECKTYTSTCNYLTRALHNNPRLEIVGLVTPPAESSVGPETCRILRLAVDEFGMNYFILTEGSILRDMGVTSLISRWGPTITELQGGPDRLSTRTPLVRHVTDRMKLLIEEHEN